MRFSDLNYRFLQFIQNRGLPANKTAPPLYARLYAKGQKQLKCGHYSAAEASFREATAEIPSGLRWPWIGVIQALDCQGKRTQAIQETLAVALTSRDSHETPAVPLPWWLFAAKGVNEQVAQDLRELVHRYPAAEEPWLSLSIVENKLGNYAAGALALQTAADLHWPRENAKDTLSIREPREHKRPGFLIIGQPKTGTTALYETLARHECIDPPLFKEPSYWSLNYECLVSWYQSNFPPSQHRPKAITFEASTDTFAHPLAAARLAEHQPAIRLILILRDPVERIFSEYNQYRRLGFNLQDWEKAIDQEISLLGNCPLIEEDLEGLAFDDSFLLRGTILPHLRRWQKLFPPDQLLILEQNQLSQNPTMTMQRVYDFLGISDQPGLLPERVNEGWYEPMLPSSEKRLQDWFAEHNRQLQMLLSDLRQPREKS